VLINSDRADKIFKDDISYKCIVDYGIQIKQNNLKNQYTKEIWTTHSDGFKVGDFVEFENKASKEKVPYLFIKGAESKEGYDAFFMQKTNNNLSFVKNHISYTVPCVITASGNSMGMDTDEMKYISEIGDFIIVRCANTSESQNIDVNQIFKLGKWNWRVESVSDIIEPNLLVMKMTWVAESADTHTYTVDILNGSASIQNGSTLQLNVNVLDNGEIISPTPTITYVSSDITKASVSTSGIVTAVSEGSCTITATSNGVSNSVSITVTNVVSDNITYTLTSVSQPDYEIKTGVTKTYIAKKFNNGIEVTGIQFNFEVIATSVPSSAYTLNIIDTKSCSIKCNQYVYNIVLRATENTTSNFVDKTIKLRSPL